MNNLNLHYFLVIIGVVAIIVEVLLGAATGFDLLLIGIIFILSGGIGLLTNSIVASLIAIAVLSLMYVFVGRSFIKNKLHIETKSTNVDAIIGKNAVVVKRILPAQAGQIKVNGEVWRAQANREIAEGSTVVIRSVSGVTLAVS